MGVFWKNAILIEEIGVDDHDGDDEPKGFQEQLQNICIIVDGSHLIYYCLAIRCLKKEYPNYWELQENIMFL